MRPELSPMMAQYQEVRGRYPGYILLFRVGDFFETFGEDAKLLARELDIVLTSRQADGSGQRIPLAGVPHHALESYLARLVRKGYGVVICDQVEDPKKAKGLVRREVTRIVTPGTVLEDSLLPAGRSNFLAAWAGASGNEVAAVLVDISTGETLLKTHPVSETALLAHEVAALAPSEIVLGPREPDDSPVRSALKDVRSVSVAVPLALNDLPVLWREAAAASPAAAVALGMAAAYVRECEPRILPHLGRPVWRRPGERLVLDGKTLRHLEVTEPMSPFGGRTPTLLDTVNQSVTSPGKRTVEGWLRSPLAEVKAIEQRLDAVEAFAGSGPALSVLRSHLREIADLSRLASRVVARRVGPREVLALGRSLAALEVVKAECAALSPTPAGVTVLLSRIDTEPELSRYLLSALVEDPPPVVDNGGFLRPEGFPDLAGLRQQEAGARSAMSALELREREATGIRTLRIGYTQAFGFYFEVTRANLDRVPEGRWRRKQSLSGGERFMSDELQILERQVLDVGEKSLARERELWEEVLARVETRAESLQRSSEALGEIDALSTFAHVARERRWTRPRVSEGGELRIREGRHPVLEVGLGTRFVPNDTDLEADESRLLLLTGPNMAGKSTYMRQVGLIVLLAQAGSFVPARFAQIGIVDHLATRMGFTDEIGQGKSSFMVEMTEVAEILGSADRRSLILLDEVGRGTSTSDGLAIAWALVKHLHDRVRARTILATHYHQLAGLVGQLPNAANAHLAVKEEEGKVTFLRTLLPGATEKSYGIHVAELAGLPESVTKEARRTLSVMEDGTSVAPESVMDGKSKRAGPRYTQALLLQDPEAEEAKRLLDELRAVDAETITPIEALNLLHELSRKLKGKEGAESPSPTAPSRT